MVQTGKTKREEERKLNKAITEQHRSLRGEIIMNEPIVASETTIFTENKCEQSGRWKLVFKKIRAFFTDPYESEWEKATGTKWREWHSGGTT